MTYLYIYICRQQIKKGSREEREREREGEGEGNGEGEGDRQTERGRERERPRWANGIEPTNRWMQSMKVAVKGTAGLRLEIVENPDLHSSGFVRCILYIAFRYIAVQ